ncbi:MAG: glucosamine-6-phosphate deaminase [Vicinamibacteraceae bacterium]
MDIEIFSSRPELERASAKRAAELIRQVLTDKDRCCLMLPAGGSQVGFIAALVEEPDVAWSRTICYHLDEYIGLAEAHPASFRRYLRERFVDKVRPGQFHLVNGEAADPEQECQRLGTLLEARPVDLAFVGIGENGHMAFNDPPADFQTDRVYLVVTLDETCRRQQVGEGWFRSLADVPKRAITASIPQILKAQHILCVVPDERKAAAVRNCLEQDIGPDYPASILRRHPMTELLLDRGAASLLNGQRSPESFTE